MGNSVLAEIKRSSYKARAFDVRIGDICGAIEGGNVSLNDAMSMIRDEVEQLPLEVQPKPKPTDVDPSDFDEFEFGDKVTWKDSRSCNVTESLRVKLHNFYFLNLCVNNESTAVIHAPDTCETRHVPSVN